MDLNLLKEIESLKEQINKLENYIKVNDYQTYKQVQKYMSMIDHNTLDYLKKNEGLRKQLEFDYRMMIKARIEDDFLEFCRYATFQIELLIDVFIKSQEQYGKISIERGDFGEIKLIRVGGDRTYEGKIMKKLDFCLDSIQIDNKVEIITVIKNIINLRNVVSHRDSSGTTVDSRIYNR